MKVSLVINAYNEGADVARTIASFRERSGGCEVEPVVVADGTTDGSAHDLPEYVKVLFCAERVGCGRAKHIGIKHATGDVILHSDGHNRIVRGTVEDLARIALDREPCVVTPALGPLRCGKAETCERHASDTCNVACDDIEDNRDIPNNLEMGGDICFNADKGLHVDNTLLKPMEPVARTLAVNPSQFAYSRATLERLGGWNLYPGWWGSQELGISLRAWFTDTPILIARDIVCLHRFRSWNHPKGKAVAPYSIPEGHPEANTRYCLRVAFSPETWDAVWRPWAARGGENHAAEALLAASPLESQHAAFQAIKRKGDREFFERALGIPLPTDRAMNPGARRGLYCVKAGLGNVVLTIPAQRALADLTGEPIDVLDCGLQQPGGVAELLTAQPWVRRVVTLDSADMTEYRYLVGSWWAKPPAFPAVGSEAVSAEAGWRTRHEVEGNFAAIRKLGYDGAIPDARLAVLPPVPADLPSSYVVVGPGCAGFHSKRYPHWSRVISGLRGEGVNVVVAGARGDPIDDTAGALDLRGRTTIPQAAALIAGAQLYLGIDNGLSHVASAVRTPAVLLYGPSSERKNAPWYSGARILRSQAYAFISGSCAPCWDHPRADKCQYKQSDARPCMGAIAPEDVVREARDALNRPPMTTGHPCHMYHSTKQAAENQFGVPVRESWAIMDELKKRRVSRVLNACEGKHGEAWSAMARGFLGCEALTTRDEDHAWKWTDIGLFDALRIVDDDDLEEVRLFRALSPMLTGGASILLPRGDGWLATTLRRRGMDCYSYPNGAALFRTGFCKVCGGP